VPKTDPESIDGGPSPKKQRRNEFEIDDTEGKKDR